MVVEKFAGFHVRLKRNGAGRPANSPDQLEVVIGGLPSRDGALGLSLDPHVVVFEVFRFEFHVCVCMRVDNKLVPLNFFSRLFFE